MAGKFLSIFDLEQFRSIRIDADPRPALYSGYDSVSPDQVSWILPMNALSFLFSLILPATAFAAESAKPANPHGNMKPAAPKGNLKTDGIAVTQSGKVLSTINVPTYTYVEVLQGKTNCGWPR